MQDLGIYIHYNEPILVWNKNIRSDFSQNLEYPKFVNIHSNGLRRETSQSPISPYLERSLNKHTRLLLQIHSGLTKMSKLFLALFETIIKFFLHLKLKSFKINYTKICIFSQNFLKCHQITKNLVV